MNLTRKRRLYAVLGIVFGVGLAVTLVLLALRENINLFYTPTQVVQGKAPARHTFRIGGLVKRHSVQRGKDLAIVFVLTDTAKEVTVRYQGILPDLFREGQGIVAQGRLNSTGAFVASQVLAKHDENYMPPEVKAAIERASTMGTKRI